MIKFNINSQKREENWFKALEINKSPLTNNIIISNHNHTGLIKEKKLLKEQII
jgi:hypothetical protein